MSSTTDCVCGRPVRRAIATGNLPRKMRILRTSADGGRRDDDLVVTDSNRTTVLGGRGNDVLLLNTDVAQITTDREIWAYGLDGADVFDIYGGIVHTDVARLDDVNYFPPP